MLKRFAQHYREDFILRFFVQLSFVAFLAALLCAVLRAEDAAPLFQVVSGENTGTELYCKLTASGKFEVVRGKEEKCWRRIVYAYNKEIDGPRNKAIHTLLCIAANNLGKVVRSCESY